MLWFRVKYCWVKVPRLSLAHCEKKSHCSFNRNRRSNMALSTLPSDVSPRPSSQGTFHFCFPQGPFPFHFFVQRQSSLLFVPRGGIWRCSEPATLKSATLACWLLWAKGPWEALDAWRTLTFPFLFKLRACSSHEKGALLVPGGEGHPYHHTRDQHQNGFVQTDLLK